MRARTTGVSVTGCCSLLARHRADAAFHVKYDHFRRAAVMHTVNPLPGKPGQRGEVSIIGRKLRLETPNLICRGSLSSTKSTQSPMTGSGYYLCRFDEKRGTGIPKRQRANHAAKIRIQHRFEYAPSPEFIHGVVV